MPRRGQARVRKIDPDSVYGSRVVAKLINNVMRKGKKSIAQKQVYEAFEMVGKKEKEEALQVFSKAIENIKPVMEVRPRRVGGAAYQVPVPVRGRRKESLALRWLITGARSRSNSEFKTFSKKLAAEIIEASKGEGAAMKKKQEVERMAEANRAFAHFRW